MNKAYIKSQIAMRQSDFPTDLKPREKSLPIDSGKIVTIPGVRRCGKTSRMETVANDLIKQGIDRSKILWVSFDDERLVHMTSEDLNLIIESYQEMYPDQNMASVYIFFDEIQLIDGWEYFVMRLYKHYTKHIYISGSNATMLSSELKTVLRGWPEEDETLPLSFKEFCDFTSICTNSWLEQDIAKLRNAFLSYNNDGGFPEIVLSSNALSKVKTLQTYFDTMILKDLAEHYKISNIEVLRYYIKRIMSNLTKPTAIRAIHNDIKSRGLKISKDTLYDWANYACNIFIFFRISNYSKSLQKAESSQPKYYCIDNGLRNAGLLPQSDEDGKKLENTVFLQLHRRRTPIDQIYYYQGRGECDFVVQRGMNIVELIQVTWTMNNNDTRKREINGLLEASAITGCNNLLIITYDESEVITTDEGKTIRVVAAWQWLLGN
jgi:predicted AAA+ superfamily ATPase